MDFLIPCSCGKKVTVNQSAAEGQVRCSCGLTITVPSLQDMRVQAGLPPYHIPPEVIIPELLSTGELPGTKSCARCTTETLDRVEILTECERIRTNRTGGFSWLTLFFTGIFFRIWYFTGEASEVQIYGKDKVYLLPLPLCGACQALLRGHQEIKQCLRKIPVYGELLDKFPHAQVTLQKPAS